MNARPDWDRLTGWLVCLVTATAFYYGLWRGGCWVAERIRALLH